MGINRFFLCIAFLVGLFAIILPNLLPNCYLFALPELFFLSPYSHRYLNEASQIDLSSQVVAIMGASQGLGADLAVVFAKHGASVVLASRNIQKLEEVQQRLDTDIAKSLVVKCDITKAEDRNRFVQSTIEKFGRIDFFIMNSGVNSYGFANMTDTDVFRKLLEINLLGSIDLTQQLLPHLQKHSGIIAAISSQAGRIPSPFMSAYSVSKFAMEGFYRTLRLEMTAEDSPVLISIVDPGAFYGDSGRQVVIKTGREVAVPLEDLGTRSHSSEVASIVFDGLMRRKREMHLSGVLAMLVPVFNFFFPEIVEKEAVKMLRGYSDAVNNASE